ncbi:hypothetical protein, secreted [gut metagenome]|uniref:Lipoprotein n=1 Tax=gut metagenome TaxID=749906 RepID=J9FPZ8_9ZZZZ
MEKKIITKLSVLTFLVAFLVSCSQDKSYIHVIPADANVVFSFHFKTLAEKADLNDKEDEATKQKLLDAIKTEINAATYQQLEKILHQPDESGIDVAAPIYIFSSPSFPYTTLVGKVNSEEDLRNSLNLMAKEDICQPVQETDTYRFCTAKNGILAFNESTAILVNVKRASQMEQVKESIAKLMQQNAENSITSCRVFTKMEEQDNDINFFADTHAKPTSKLTQYTKKIPSEFNPQEVKVIGELNFEKGEILLKGNFYTENEEAKALLEKQMSSMDKIKGTFYDYFPASTILFGSVHLNGDKFYSLLSESKEFRQSASVAKAEALNQVFKAMKGDISVGVVNINLTKAPAFMLYADFNDGKILEQIYQNKKNLNLKKGEDLLGLSPNEYVYKSREMNVFYGIKDKKFYATNDELLYKNIGKPADKSIKETTYASDMKGESLYGVVNANAILELPVVKMAAGFGGKKAEALIKQVGQIDYFSFSFKDSQFQYKISLKNKDVNALKQVKEFARLLTHL